MDDALVLKLSNPPKPTKVVLILVLMDDALVHYGSGRLGYNLRS